jgi:alpha-amylase
VPGSHSLTFVQNHDTERNGDALSYKDGATNILANEFLLAFGYGRPEVYSSFAWTTSDDSPPSDANGMITDTDCASAAWVCVDRDPGVLGLVRWHDQVGNAPVAHWWDDQQNLIAFSRGSRGWVALDNDPVSHTHTFQTGLPKGRYCDVVHGSVSHGVCSGPTVSVDGQGRAMVTVPAKDAVAFTVADRLPA